MYAQYKVYCITELRQTYRACDKGGTSSSIKIMVNDKVAAQVVGMEAKKLELQEN